MRWPYVYGIPILPADVVNKRPILNHWNTADLSKVNFKAEMLKGTYDKGQPARLGPTLQPGIYSIALDFDDWDAVIAWFGTWENVLTYSKKSLVEWHQNKVYLRQTILHMSLYQRRRYISERTMCFSK